MRIERRGEYKKQILLFLVTLGLITGLSMADTGIDPVPETQGIVTSTTIDMIGNFASASDLQWRITDDAYGLDGLPVEDPDDHLEGDYYQSVYSEETQSNGVGLIAYDKELDVETGGQISGQWNIEAGKELLFVGTDGARVLSTDTILVDGISYAYDSIPEQYICPFAGNLPWMYPGTYCNYAEAGSTIDMTVANVRTTSTDRFIMPSADYPVELNHDILVTELVSGLPSTGSVSAHMDVLVMENYDEEWDVWWPPLAERVEFSEETSIGGDMTLFEKLMHYDSVRTGAGSTGIAV